MSCLHLHAEQTVCLSTVCDGWFYRGNYMDLFNAADALGDDGGNEALRFFSQVFPCRESRYSYAGVMHAGTMLLFFGGAVS